MKKKTRVALGDCREREAPSTPVTEWRRAALVKSVELEVGADEPGGRDEAHTGVRAGHGGADAGAGTGASATAEAEPASPTPAPEASGPPLPAPRWGTPRDELRLDAANHEELVMCAEVVLRRLLVSDNYDSVHNFLGLYETWERERGRGELLRGVFKRYAPPIRPRRHTCVGLALELVRRWRALEGRFPGLCAATALVSCEEAVGATALHHYVSSESPALLPTAEKEHVLVCVRVSVDGRAGLLLADPGYHVARVVTVMADRAYPHTGWFTQSEDGAEERKDYSYALHPLHTGYVEWRERVVNDGGEVRRAERTSLVYVARPYLDAVHVTERRNLVYNFRSVLARDKKGQPVAGLYFPVGAAHFTLFRCAGTIKTKSKYKFSNFIDPIQVPETVVEEIEQCNTQMNYKTGELQSIICRLAHVVSDESFIDQLLAINDDICRLTHVGLIRQLTPGSGRTPAHQDYHVSCECEYEQHRKHLRHKPSRSRPTPTGANAGRPACVCAAEHARRALRPGPACALFVTTLNLLRPRTYTPPHLKLMSPHFNLLKCRRLGTAANADMQCTGTAARERWKCPTPRAYHAADGGAPARTSWDQLLKLRTDASGGPSPIGKTTLTRARRRGQRLADAYCFGCSCWMHG
ncbi:hypothetical protein EVAR_78305_1 [Eumeta japonica]|uniref:Uncharacterized protein n=1 Tax=Eumeta variegata TaxID=151549 RepID=A0A4C1T666_EUMVA|nr:hypothetical protein EVAR_78305_1 [Eumeta japonica]